MKITKRVWNYIMPIFLIFKRTIKDQQKQVIQSLLGIDGSKSDVEKVNA